MQPQVQNPTSPSESAPALGGGRTGSGTTPYGSFGGYQTGTGTAQPTPQSAPAAGQPGTGESRPSSGSQRSGTSSVGRPGAEQVKAVQQALQGRGLDPGPIDGVLSPRTQAALRQFQRDQYLPETGRLDPKTLERLGVASR
jgi:hypothetical protein